MAFLSFFVGAGTTGFTFSIFLPAMLADLGWSRGVLVGAHSLGAVAASLAAPWIGGIVDRRGARGVLALSVVCTGAALALSARVQSPWQFFLAYGLIGGVARAPMMSVAPGAMIANWFVRRRTLAFSIAALGPPAVSLVSPPVIAAMVAALGWRHGWTGLGAVAVGIALAPIVLLVRRRPEDLGLTPDGDPPAAAPPTPVVGSERAAPVDWTFRETLRSPAFWMVACAMALIGLAPMTATLFMFPFFRDQGLSPSVAAATISVMSFFQVVSRIGFWAPVITRLGSVRWALLIWGGLLFFSTLFMAATRTEMGAYLAAGFLGLAMGGNLVLQLQIWPEYFGLTAVGAITGTAQLVNGLSYAAWPLIGAALLDATGDYTLFYMTVAGFVLLGLALLVVAGRPRRPTTVTHELR